MRKIILILIIILKFSSLVKSTGESSGHKHVDHKGKGILMADEENKQISELLPTIHSLYINIKIESGIIPEELIRNGVKLEELVKDQRYRVMLYHLKLDKHNTVLPGGRLIGTEITQKYDTITFVLPNELAESMEVYVEPDTGLYKYKKNNKFSIYVSKNIINSTSNFELKTFFELDLVTNIVKINLKEPKELKVVLYNPLEFDCPQRYFSFKFEKMEHILPIMLSCTYPEWTLPIKDGEIFYREEVTHVCRGDEYILHLQYSFNEYVFPLIIKCDEALFVEKINLYYINFEIDENGNIRAFCSLVGFNSKGPFNAAFVNLLKMITKPKSTTKQLESGSASKSPDLDIPDAKRVKKERKPRKPKGN